ncbi:uroporphyrinogen-III synthase [Arboricoccus pini]|uniref:Uroporphyrinogen-III synthase n=1 Tax=Arboricoccus pini TaxID=1963835 RepID=A0A212Q133_9PROT|nr:uroporphyrinogen-III synthase [Arboricoccus pini]SNB53045.1 uroporphyrinogen-III synthase [Arboricoccus pini]
MSARQLVLLTRPRRQSLATARALKRKGYRSLIYPLLSIERLDHAEPDLRDIAGIVLTSANAATALDDRMRQMPLFAVGEATAAAARSLGARHVTVGQKDGRALAGRITSYFNGRPGALLHLAGEQVRDGLEEALVAAGLGYRRLTVYRAQEARTLSQRVLDALRRDEFVAVMLFSPRAATIFRNLLAAADLLDRAECVTAVCMSEAVAACVCDLAWQAVRVADLPSQDAMLKCLR